MVEKCMRGKTSHYSKQIAEEILFELMDGKTLTSICRAPHRPSVPTVCKWVKEDRQGFRERYMQAREIGYTVMADDIIDIVDNGENDYTLDEKGEPIVNHDHIRRSIARAEKRQWMISQTLPKIYGNKKAVDVTSSDGSLGGEPVERTVNINFVNPPGYEDK